MNDEWVTRVVTWWYVIAFAACIAGSAFFTYAAIHFIVKFW